MNDLRIRSLRWRLVLASVLVEVVLLGILVLNSHRLIHGALIEQAQARLEEMGPLLNASLAAPLAERDLATLGDLLRESRRERGIHYLVLRDHAGQVVAVAGWDPARPLPAAEAHGPRDDDDARYDTTLPIELAGQRYGTLHFGLSLAFLREAQSDLLRQSLLIAAAEVTLSVVLLTVIGLWLTRHLARLTEAARRIGRGEFGHPLPVTTGDEVGALTGAFNTMSAAIREHLRDLAASEERYRRLAGAEQRERARMGALLSAMNIGILFEDEAGDTVYVNPAFARIWRIPEGTALEGTPARDFIRHSPNVLARPDHFSRHLLQVTAASEISESFEIVLADGRLVSQLTFPVRGDGNRIIGRLWIYEDVTRERQTAEQLIYLAERDSLTGLYNRHRFQEELNRMLAAGERRGRRGALLFFDLDEFKYVNDTYGHRAGDSMLIRVAGEAGTLVRRNEVLARLGGDEFAVLVEDADEAEATGLADRIVRAVSKIPFRIEGQNLRLTTSVGIALYPDHGTAAEELVSHADAAMYQAKDAGKNAWRVYRPDLDESRVQVSRMNWRDRIRRALEQDLLRVHFQGVYHARGRGLSHLEALVRMADEHDPTRLVLPGHFISIAEQSGQIIDIDRWVIARCVEVLAAHPDLRAIAVNVSARSFDAPGLAGEIADLLSRGGVEHHRLVVELTETAAVSDLSDAQRFIESLQRSGCEVCLDDFGTGFASFAYLKHLHVDALKIDGMFIRDLPSDRDNQVLVRAISEVARGLRKTTIAEYVEDEETLRMVADMGVDLVQGYHLDVPRADHPALASGARAAARVGAGGPPAP